MQLILKSSPFSISLHSCSKSSSSFSSDISTLKIRRKDQPSVAPSLATSCHSTAAPRGRVDTSLSCSGGPLGTRDRHTRSAVAAQQPSDRQQVASHTEFRSALKVYSRQHEIFWFGAFYLIKTTLGLDSEGKKYSLFFAARIFSRSRIPFGAKWWFCQHEEVLRLESRYGTGTVLNSIWRQESRHKINSIEIPQKISKPYEKF